MGQNGLKWNLGKNKKIENSPPSNVNKVISYHVMASDLVKNRPFRVKNGPKVVKMGRQKRCQLEILWDQP